MGAILTQNTAWSNVEKAIANLKRSGSIESISKLKSIGSSRLAGLIRPAGYYNIKAKRLKCCLDFLHGRLGPDMRKVSSIKTGDLRKELLGVHGIGPETADSILLYAFGRPVFVVDAYTRRIFSRHGLISGDEDYETIREVFMKNLSSEERLFNEYHALIVNLGKNFCRPKARCEGCPLDSAKYYFCKVKPRCKRA